MITVTFENGRWCLRGPRRKPRQKSALERSLLRGIKAIKRVKRKYAWMQSRNEFNRNTWFEVFTK